MVTSKYYIDIPTTTYVWFKLLDDGDKTIQDFGQRACFADIKHGFSEDARQINVYHEKAKVPYSKECINRWITDLNEMGFPCSFVIEELPDLVKQQEQYVADTVNDGLTDMMLSFIRHGQDFVPANPHHNFFISLKDYADKNHLFSTLSLIRCLTESGICKIPEVYFGLMDENPGRDKLEACQMAHKIVSNKTVKYDPTSHANISHMVTFDGNGENITKEKLLGRFSQAKLDLRNAGYLRLNANWNGNP